MNAHSQLPSRFASVAPHARSCVPRRIAPGLSGMALGTLLLAGCTEPDTTSPRVIETDVASLDAISRPDDASIDAEAASLADMSHGRAVMRAGEASFAGSAPIALSEPLPIPVENRERYAESSPAPVQRVRDAPVSTFSIDVDTGSYANVRRHLMAGMPPPPDAVRVEELVNYFDYAYPGEASAEQPFTVSTARVPTPWNAESELLRIGIRGLEVDSAFDRPANLVFLIDVSGSMASPDKLGLLTSSLSLLARGLDADDSVSIVTYAGAAGTVLDGVAGNDVQAIDMALARLSAGGSTAGEAGIRAAYRLAREHATDDSVDRVILATDGDFNVGLADTDALLALIERQRDSGVALTTLGFGTGNYNDELMERLADAGDGHHAYIDMLGEARKVLSEQLAGTLFTIAKDVKVQIEFNPAKVAEYRLIGYENRALADEDFANDRVDAGDIGAGHTVTALYEIVRTGREGWLSDRRYDASDALPDATSRTDDPRTAELGELRLRFKLPVIKGGDAASRLVTVPLLADDVLPSIEAADADLRFAIAVAAWGEWLRDPRYLNDFDADDVLALARGARGDDPFGYRSGFIELVELSRVLEDRVPTLGGIDIDDDVRG